VRTGRRGRESHGRGDEREGEGALTVQVVVVVVGCHVWHLDVCGIKGRRRRGSSVPEFEMAGDGGVPKKAVNAELTVVREAV